MLKRILGGPVGVAGFGVMLLVIGVCVTRLDHDKEPSEEISTPGIISGAEYLDMTQEQFSERLGEEGFSEEAIGRALADFEGNKAKFVEHRSKFPTPVPREWTAAELADCDTSTLKRQLATTLNRQEATSESTEELLSDCEVGFSIAQLETLGTIDGMPDRARSVLDEQMELVESIGQGFIRILADNVIDRDELIFMCSVVPQWIEQLEGVDRYIESLGRSDLQGLEIDVIKTQKLVSETYGACVQDGLLSEDLSTP